MQSQYVGQCLDTNRRNNRPDISMTQISLNTVDSPSDLSQTNTVHTASPSPSPSSGPSSTPDQPNIVHSASPSPSSVSAPSRKPSVSQTSSPDYLEAPHRVGSPQVLQHRRCILPVYIPLGPSQYRHRPLVDKTKVESGAPGSFLRCRLPPGTPSHRHRSSPSPSNSPSMS